MSDPVVIIGGGLAGLTCAKELHAQGIEFVLLEASDAVGGRVRTDEVDGFLLDRGFQVLLTAYPEAQRQLDYSALELRSFQPGSIIRMNDSFQRMSDPWRRPQHAIQTAMSAVGSLMDKIRIGRLRWSAGKGTLDSQFERPDQTTLAELRQLGFSDRIIEHFFRPFLGGVFLDADLETSCRMLYFVFRMFSQGDTSVPAKGMGQIPSQLAAHLPEDSVRCNSVVSEIHSDAVSLASGDKISCSKIVLALEQPAAAKLLPELKAPATPRSVRCVYFAATESPVADQMLVLNGTQTGVVNNFCVPSQISASYAPSGQTLISATVLADTVDAESLPQTVANDLRPWFGNVVDSWQHLRTYNIKYALPNQTSPAFNPAQQPSELRPKLYVCGDYRTNGSINGAMVSGRLTAEKIVQLS